MFKKYLKSIMIFLINQKWWKRMCLMYIIGVSLGGLGSCGEGMSHDTELPREEWLPQ